MIKDIDFGKLVVIGSISKGNMVIRLIKHVELSYLPIIIDIPRINIS